MDFMAALNAAITVVGIIQKAAPIVSKAIDDFSPIVEASVQKLTGNPLTEDQRNLLRAKIIDAHNEFQNLTPEAGEG